MARYQPPRSGLRSLAMALIAPLVLAAGVYAVLDRPSMVVPAPVAPPDTAQRSIKSDTLLYTPSPIPKAAPAVVPSKPVVRRALGPGVFKCEDSNGAVTYSGFPCGDGTMIDTRPTSGGFAEQWTVTVKGR